jgi:hypothetical protein
VRSLLTSVFIIIVIVCAAQRPYRGIVVDSATMLNMPDVHITILGTNKGVVTNTMGGFLIYAQPTDTLMFTALGYAPLQLPLLFEEDAMMIMLRELIQVLPEVTIRSTRLYPNTIENRTHSAPRTMDSFSAVTSPFDYFSRREKEKRRLFRLVEENNRTQTYVQVITDPDVKKILTEAFELTDEQYYDRVVQFNQKNMAVQYFTDPDKIMEALYAFFSRSIGH